jgi:four helix bundle protein
MVNVYHSAPRGRAAEAMAYQAFRSGTSVGAQYREACRSRSMAELISKMESTLQEIDETNYWLDLLIRSKTFTAKRLQPLLAESDELMRMFVTAIRNIKRRR